MKEKKLIFQNGVFFLAKQCFLQISADCDVFSNGFSPDVFSVVAPLNCDKSGFKGGFSL